MTLQTAERARPLDPVEVYVGSQIRLRRKLLGMSQEQLAAQIGVTFQQLQKYEKGTNRVGAGRLFRIARLLEVQISDLFPDSAAPQGRAGAEEAPGMKELPVILTSADAIELIHAFARIQDTKLRHKLVSLVKSLAEGIR